MASHLTDRDRFVCRMLSEHQVLTTAQVTHLCFSGTRRAEQRLSELHAWEVLDRFRPRTWAGSGLYHWLLGPAGAVVVAAEDGVDPSEIEGRRHGAALALAKTQRLSHLVGVNGFFCSLVRSARDRAGCGLAEWWSERRCAAEWGALVRPDGYGVWVEAGLRLPFLLEYDRGTERLARLDAKLAGYAALAEAAGHPTWVVFSFPSPSREAEGRRVLRHPGVPLATATLGSGRSPDGPVWLPVGESGRRRALIELSDPGRVLDGGPRPPR